ncbi:MAG: efflux RND transporter periplasmic adaptor subunit [Gammaproteobacteria bacterium]
MIDLHNKRVRIGLAATGAVIVALFFLRGGDGKEAALPDAAAAGNQPLLLVPADVVTVSQGSVSGGIRVTGTLDPVTRTSVNARVGGVVNAVPVRAGETVHRGQLLVQQDTADLRAQLAQAEAQLHSADVELKLVEAYERRKKELYEKKYLSEVDWATAQGETEFRRASKKVQEAAVDMARKALADAGVTAPIAGIVAERLVEPGTRVAPGQTLVTLVNLSELELAAAIPARDVPQVKVGSEVRFTVDGLGDREFRGRVARVNPMATSGARTITVYARVANTDGALRGGMFASGRIAAGASRKDALRIPAAAVRQVAGNDHVWLIRDGKLALQPVTLGIQDGGTGLVEVKQGVAAGEQVVLAQIGLRTPGTPVTVAAPR